MNLKQAAWFSAIPWGMMAISGYIAGRASDFMIKAGSSITLVRKIMQVIKLSKMTQFRKNSGRIATYTCTWNMGETLLNLQDGIVLD